eukprot:355623-Chlamydomonas_euryale.AAC.3
MNASFQRAPAAPGRAACARSAAPPRAKPSITRRSESPRSVAGLAPAQTRRPHTDATRTVANGSAAVLPRALSRRPHACCRSRAAAPRAGADAAAAAAAAPQPRPQAEAEASTSASSSAATKHAVAIFVEPSPFSHVSGMKNRFECLIKGLRDAGDEVIVYTPDPSPPEHFCGAKVCGAGEKKRVGRGVYLQPRLAGALVLGSATARARTHACCHSPAPRQKQASQLLGSGWHRVLGSVFLGQ